MNTKFKVIGLTRLGIKPKFTATGADALTTWSSELIKFFDSCKHVHLLFRVLRFSLQLTTVSNLWTELVKTKNTWHWNSLLLSENSTSRSTRSTSLWAHDYPDDADSKQCACLSTSDLLLRNVECNELSRVLCEKLFVESV